MYTDPEAIDFVENELRPLSERLIVVRAVLDAAYAEYVARGIGPKLTAAGADTIGDANSERHPLTGTEALAVTAAINTVRTALAGIDFAPIDQAAVRSLSQMIGG